jgi:hypothetical protein
MESWLRHPAGEHEIMGEGALAHDVARDPAEIGADRPERPIGALELFRMRVALVSDQRMLADPLIGLSQLDAGCLRQLRQPLARFDA